MKERIVAIDVLRGVALLGILLMNMASFAMPGAAYFNPTVYGGDDIWNRLVFGLSHIFVDQKMMALFSMLFGASVVLVTSNMERKGESSFRFHYLRNFWLLIIGLFHSILIWDGDILVIYALCSFVLYWFRHWKPGWQITIGLLIFFLPSILNLWINSLAPVLQTADFYSLDAFWQPSNTAIDQELALYRGPYLAQVAYRWGDSVSTAATTLGQDLLDLSLLVEFFCRAFGMMLVGMAFYTWGILTAKRSETFYEHMMLIGFGIGLPLALFSLIQYTNHDWSPFYSLFVGRIPNHLATPFMASGYVALVMIWSRSNVLDGLQTRLAAVGRMALTNYIAQSIMATAIFYGFGLGFFGYRSRIEQLIIVLFIWAIQLVFSSWWLSRFRYGPLEWVWRSLSYWYWQPIRPENPISERAEA